MARCAEAGFVLISGKLLIGDVIIISVRTDELNNAGVYSLGA
jgi:hypothetical protein